MLVLRSPDRSGRRGRPRGSWSFSSPGSEIAAQVHRHCFDDLDNHVGRVHSDDVPAPYAYNLEQEMLPNARKICEAVREVTYSA